MTAAPSRLLLHSLGASIAAVAVVAGLMAFAGGAAATVPSPTPSNAVEIEVPACAVDGDGVIADGSAFDTITETATFGAALEASTVDELLPERAPFTVFAPNDDAFEAIPPNVFDSILQDQTLLDAVIAQHVVVGQQLSFGQLVAGSPVDSASGAPIFALDADAGPVVGSAGSADVGAVISCMATFDDGVVYVIGTVLQPGQDCATPATTGSSVPGSSSPSSVPSSSAPGASTPGASVPGAIC